MAIRIVNTAPGDISDPIAPGQPVTFSLRSDSGSLDPTSLHARLSFSNIVHKTADGIALLPEQNDLLPNVVIETPERRRPIDGIVPRRPVGTDFAIGPGSNSVDVQSGIYEVTIPLDALTPVLASVSFRLSNWTAAQRYWCDLPDLLPLYFGLEYGTLNTGIFAFLRDDGDTGSVVCGGPLAAYDTERLGQAEAVAGWKNEVPASIFTLYLLIDPKVDSAEVWVRSASDSGPRRLMDMPVGWLGVFESGLSNFSQRRSAASNIARFFFGINGGAGESLQITDFAIHENFATAIKYGVSEPTFFLSPTPELPFSYRSANGVLPGVAGLGTWVREGAGPEPTFFYYPGQRVTPIYTVLEKQTTGLSFFRREPTLARRMDGFVVESWMGGLLDEAGSVSTGIGFFAEDGERRFEVVILDDQRIRTFGILKDRAQYLDIDAGYYTPRDADGAIISTDYRGLRLLRLVVDRLRDVVQLFVDDMLTPLISVPFSSEFPFAAAPDGQVGFGHLGTSALSVGHLKLGHLSYLTHYAALEKSDALLPDAPELAARQTQFVLSAPDSGFSASILAPDSVNPGTLALSKTDFGELTDRKGFYYRNADDLSIRTGLQVDFRARVVDYKDKTGLSDAPNTWTGAGVEIFFGVNDSPAAIEHRLHLGFFDCGPFGRRIAIIPGTGSIDDIIYQTPLGKKWSARVDWGEFHSYRLSYRAYDKLEVWVDSVLDQPVISIPWNPETLSFDLPKDPDLREAAFAFGLFNSEVAVETEWEFFRWGLSEGQDFALTKLFSDEEIGRAIGGHVLATVVASERFQQEP